MTLKISSFANEEEYTTENLNNIVNKIWSRRDSILLVLGSNPCIRAIYLKAISEEKAHQFSYCHIYKIDYVLGKAEEKIKNKLLEILQKRSKAKIFIYVSCMEIVTGVDFDKIIESIKEEKGNVNIFEIRRGPMVKRYLKPKEHLEKIFHSLEKQEEEIEKIYEEPVFAGEVEIFANSLEYADYKKCIIEPGGCVSCILKNNSEFDKRNLYSTTFNDIDMSLGLEKQLILESEKILKNENKNVIFFETILPQIVNFDETILETYFLNEEKNNYILKTEDGKSAFEVLKQAHFIGLKELFKKYKKGNKILICSYSNLNKIQKNEIVNSFEKDEYVIKIEGELPQKLIIVNLEGLIFMHVYQKFEKISYKIIYPQRLYFETEKIKKDRNILILGDPIQIIGYKKILKKNFKIERINLGFYYPDIKFDEEIKEFFQKKEIKFYNSTEEIKQEITRDTILICDKQIDNVIKNKLDMKYEFIELSYHWLSGYKNF